MQEEADTQWWATASTTLLCVLGMVLLLCLCRYVVDDVVERWRRAVLPSLP